jgi:hypothetical protein
MLAELVERVIGVGPDRDWITAAVVDAREGDPVGGPVAMRLGVGW